MQAVPWEARVWRKNLDVTVADPKHPQAFPARRPTDLMGRIRVRLRAEDDGLVAYGFGGQRIVLPASSIGEVRTVDAYRTGLTRHGKALLVLDHEERILLRAGGLWETNGEVKRVCRAAGLPAPTHVNYFTYVTYSPGRTGRAGRHSRPSPPEVRRIRRRGKQPPLYRKAPGYRRLRTAPRGTTMRVLAQLIVALTVIGLTAYLGALPAVALPDWIGSVRVLIGIAGAALGAAAGLWLCAAVAHVAADALRWAVTSAGAGGLAPPARFFRRRGLSARWTGATTVALAALVPALIGWGPAVAIASAAHGVSDSRLVAELRAQGTRTPGALIDVQHQSTDDHGNLVVTDVPTLSFIASEPGFLQAAGPSLSWHTTDPSIGGRPLPLNQADPVDTFQPLTVVYLPTNPNVAAAQQQLAGSVWHGAPTANEITGVLFTLALPPLIWFLALRIRRQRWLRDAGLHDLAVT